MRASREVMAQRHAEIIAQTSKLLRERGILGTSLADLMAAAGLTHGGFYKHFDSKHSLVVEAINQIFAEIKVRFEERTRSMGAKAAVKTYVTWYLSSSHINNPQDGCPIPSFGNDISREEGATKTAFTSGVKSILEHVIEGLSCPSAVRRERALELVSLLAGAVLMARASSDEKLAMETLASARKRAVALIDARR